MADQTRTRLAGPSRPLGDPDIPQFFLPAGTESPKGVYAPRLYGSASILFSDRKRRVSETRRVAFLAPLDAVARTLDWDAARPTEATAADLLTAPPAPADYLPLPAGAMRVTTFTRWAKSFDRWLARTQRVVPPAPAAKPGEPPAEPVTVGPKRGGVNIELVAIVWELT